MADALFHGLVVRHERVVVSQESSSCTVSLRSDGVACVVLWWQGMLAWEVRSHGVVVVPRGVL